MKKVLTIIAFVFLGILGRYYVISICLYDFSWFNELL